MLYIHDSLNTPKFLNDKKLYLLRTNVITEGQFMNLLSLNDPYTVIGPAVVDKSKINQFLEEWKNSQNTMTPLQDAFVRSISQQEIIDHLDALVPIFPEIFNIVKELKTKLKDAECPICVKSRYILYILLKIQQNYNDGRDLKDQQGFIEQVLKNYFPFAHKVFNMEKVDEFDITWIKPDTLVALGADLIAGLSHCFECCKKHLSRAKILFEEWHQKYPEHGTIMYNEFIEANRDIEEGYTMFWDSLGQLDMASGELVGNIMEIDEGFRVEIINLANEIRAARILFQEDSNQVPDFAKLRLDVQKLQNKINKVGELIQQKKNEENIQVEGKIDI